MYLGGLERAAMLCFGKILCNLQLLWHVFHLDSFSLFLNMEKRSSSHLCCRQWYCIIHNPDTSPAVLQLCSVSVLAAEALLTGGSSDFELGHWRPRRKVMLLSQTIAKACRLAQSAAAHTSMLFHHSWFIKPRINFNFFWD